MKKLLTGLLLLGSLSTFASLLNCQKLASMSVIKTFAENFVSADGSQLRIIDSSDCYENKQTHQIECEVLTNDGTGSLDVFYNVTLENDCKSLLNVGIYYIE